MSMEHKAFGFGWNEFTNELGSDLHQALATGEIAPLVAFIDGNVPSLRDSSTGRPLSRDWKKPIATADAHQYGDIALTKFYDPIRDIGLGDAWQEIETLLQTLGIDPTVILGKPFGPSANYFDPGKMGSYFQTPEQVSRHRQILQERSAPRLLSPLAMFRRAPQGLYITF